MASGDKIGDRKLVYNRDMDKDLKKQHTSGRRENESAPDTVPLADIQREAYKRVDKDETKQCRPCDIAAAFSVALNICQAWKNEGLDCKQLEQILNNPEQHTLDEAMSELKRLATTTEGELKDQFDLLCKLAEGKQD